MLCHFVCIYLDTDVLVGHYFELPVNIKGVPGTKCLNIVCLWCESSSAYHTLLSKKGKLKLYKLEF